VEGTRLAQTVTQRLAGKSIQKVSRRDFGGISGEISRRHLPPAAPSRARLFEEEHDVSSLSRLGDQSQQAGAAPSSSPAYHPETGGVSNQKAASDRRLSR
jgi:hypothetical protein